MTRQVKLIVAPGQRWLQQRCGTDREATVDLSFRLDAVTAGLQALRSISTDYACTDPLVR